MREVFLLTGLAIALLCTAGAARALDDKQSSHVARPAIAGRDASSPLSISLSRRKIALEKGVEVIMGADTAKPGDILEEVATYTNVSQRRLTVSEATLPVPPETTFQEGSAKPADVYASVDGKKYERLPIRVKFRQADGSMAESNVPPEEYRFLRWLPGQLGPGQSVSFSARFRIDGGSGSGRQHPN